MIRTVRRNAARVSLLAVVALLLGLLFGPMGDASGPRNPRRALTASGAFSPGTIDLHDGMVLHSGSTYYLYGTLYGCGYNWYVANTPWCGFGVSTAPSLSGPWTTPTLLFDPNSIDPWSNVSWQTECGGNGLGCFNLRMIQRSGWGANDGVWVAWFNSPQDWANSHANAYNAMGCNGPAGPCGPGAGAPHGSYTKPSLSDCGGNGDFGFIQAAPGSGQAPAMICTEPGAASLSIEQLNYWGVGGGSGNHNVASLTSIEGPGGYWDPTAGKYVLTYSDPGCGYCAGTGTGYATATALMGPYTAPANVAAASPVTTGRRDVSATSCGGQPRTVSVVDGVPYQGIDLWTGSRNETTAGLWFAPLTWTTPTGSAGDGGLWTPPLSYPCG